MAILDLDYEKRDCYNQGSTSTAKWAPYSYRIFCGYGYCRGTHAYPGVPVFSQKIKFLVRVRSGPVRVGYRRGPKLSQTASFPLDFFSSLTRFSLLSLRQSHSILSLTSSLYRRRATKGAPILDLRR